MLVDFNPKNKITGNIVGIKTEKTGLFGLISLIVLFVTFILVYIVTGGVPINSKTTRAKILHRRGQNAFEAGNNSKAKRCYTRASKLRNSHND